MPRIAWFLALVVLSSLTQAQGWTPTGGGDHGGMGWTPTPGTPIAGVHTNIGVFTVSAGDTILVEPWNGASFGTLEIHAASIVIDGTLDATAAGFTGGAAASMPGSYGVVGTGPGAGNPGYGNPGNAYGRGGGGAGYGGEGGDAGHGGATPSGEGGPGYGVSDLVSAPPSDDDIEMGSGGGGGGEQNSGGVATDGGNGGGRVLLISSGDLIVTGEVLALGGTSQPTPDVSGTGGGGSGGGILLQGNRVDVSAGTLDASGGSTGDSGRYAGSPGGGGRIKIFWNDPTSSLVGTQRVDPGLVGITVWPPLTPSLAGTIFTLQTAPPVPPSSWDGRLVAPSPAAVDAWAMIDVPFELDVAGATLGSYAARVAFDPSVFQATTVLAGSSPLGAPTMAVIDNVAGTVDLAGTNATMSLLATGTLELAVVRLQATGPAGAASVLSAEVTSVLDLGGAPFGAPAPRLAASTAAGLTLEVGDADRNGTVTILDALRIAQIAAAILPAPTQRIDRLVVDTDGDGDADILDALRTAQLAAAILAPIVLPTPLDPYIATISPPDALPMATVTVNGEVFSNYPGDIEVTIAGLTAAVTMATRTDLEVVVPALAPPGPTTLTVVIGGRTSAAVAFTVN